MKRDMELIRLLLRELNGEDVPELASYSEENIVYNLRLMLDANFIVGTISPHVPGARPIVDIKRLTWDGHDFLDATKDSKVWKLVLDHIIKPGVSWTFQSVLVYLKSQIVLNVPILGFPNP